MYHYTKPETANLIVKQATLNLTPIQDFHGKAEGKDDNEYRRGLSVIEGTLRAAITDRRRLDQFTYLVLRDFKYLPARAISATRLLADVCDRLNAELASIDTPLVQVYVASLTPSGNSDYMREAYGKGIVRFGRELPCLAYATPSPFTQSMLTRVSYGDDELRAFSLSPSMSFTPAYLRAYIDEVGLERIKVRWCALEPTQFRSAMADLIAEQYCVVAPNIKMSSFRQESEWRLKCVVSGVNNGLDLGRTRRQPVQKYPVEATKYVRAEGARPRYLMSLMVGGASIVSHKV